MKPLPLLLLTFFFTSQLVNAFAFASGHEFAKDSVFMGEVQQSLKSYVSQLETSNTLMLDGEQITGNSTLYHLYRDTEFFPLWNNAKNRQDLISELDASYFDGLFPDDYHVESIKKYDSLLQANADIDPDIAARFDLIMTNSLLTFSYHMIQGKVHPTRLDPNWNYSYRHIPDSAEFKIMHHLQMETLGQGIESIRPELYMYKLLKKWFAYFDSLKVKGTDVPQIIYPGKPLRKGDSSEIVGQLKRHLRNYEYAFSSTEDNVFDKELEETLKEFQKVNGIDNDGVAGKKTFDALNLSIDERMDILRVNLERCRWISNDLPEEFVLVNIADFRLYIFRDGQIDYTSRVVVGKEHHETPVFNSNIQYVVFNPTWSVPYSIATKEMLPKLKKDKHYLQNRDMVLLKGGTEIDPLTVDFGDYSERHFPFTIRQEPGPQNALGTMKFIFPNQYSVYLHDTPSKSFFEKSERAFSHGCVRVQHPELLAEQLLGNKGYDQRKINEVLGTKQTTTVYLKAQMPVYLMYWTCYQSRKDNKIYFYQDIYGRDQKVLSELYKKRNE